MSSSESDSDGDAWVPFRERPEWSDVTPVPQDDGPNPVVPIAYTSQFKETMDYFRAVLAMDERSQRALHLTEEVIKLNASNYTVWHFRRVVLEALSYDLWQELEFITEIAESNYKNYQIWHHRRWTAENIGVAVKQSELDFTEKVFQDDAKNYHAWSHRQWVLKALGGWEGELEFCNKLLRQDIYNNSAWNQRYFVLKNSPLHGGIHNMRESEIMYCKDAIEIDPTNESPWRYLKGLFKGENEILIKTKAVIDICLEELKKNTDCIFALDFVLDAIGLGYEPSLELAVCLGLGEEQVSASNIGNLICSHLKEIDTMRTLYWDWRQAALDSNTF